MLKKFPNSKHAAKWKSIIQDMLNLKNMARRIWARIDEIQSRELPSPWMTRKLKRNTPRPEVKEVFKFNSESLRRTPRKSHKLTKTLSVPSTTRDMTLNNSKHSLTCGPSEY